MVGPRRTSDNLGNWEREIESRFTEVMRMKGGSSRDGDVRFILALSHADLIFANSMK